jgi:hypothetical protein
MKYKLKVTVNKNETKEGVKIQFIFPQPVEGEAKGKITQELQKKLTDGLSQYNLTVSRDQDIPKALTNIIGFTIPILDIREIIKGAIAGGKVQTPTTPEPPAEPPVVSTPEETPTPALQ